MIKSESELTLIILSDILNNKSKIEKLKAWYMGQNYRDVDYVIICGNLDKSQWSEIIFQIFLKKLCKNYFIVC